jgi:DNA-binding NarL/FixJ family response regulator
MITVLIADDNAVVREGLAAVLDTQDDLDVVGRAADGRQAVDLARRAEPDVVLLDVRMPGGDGITAAAALAPLARVLMLTYTDDDETVTAALRAGAHGYLVHGTHTPEELVDAVRRVHAGEVVLGATAASAVVAALREAPRVVDVAATFGVTRREAEVLDRLANGRSNAEIAEELYLSPKTVKNHLHNAYAKLGVATRAEAIALWLRGPDSAASNGRPAR